MKKALLPLGAAVVLLAAQAAPCFAQDLSYVKPSSIAGKGLLLSLPEIRWCKREKIRLETMRDIVNSPGGREQVSAAVGEFNDRCGHYRSKKDVEATAKREVEARRDQIVAEAKKDAEEMNRHGASSKTRK